MNLICLKTTATKILAVALLLIVSSLTAAEQKKTFANYDVHYIAFNSTVVPPEVAKAYGITRGDNRGVVNISIRRQNNDGTDSPQRAIIKGSSTDLIHRRELDFQEVIEQGAIYYLAEFRYDDKDMRHFDIQVQPNANIAPYRLKFSQTLYNDD